MPNEGQSRGIHAFFVAVLLLFFCSGASGLVYQVIWVRLLTRVFGTTTFAVSVLLAGFMAGLGLGSFLVARYLPGIREPLRWFGFIEIGIGGYALALNGLLLTGERVFLGLVSHFGFSWYGEALTKVLLSFLILLPPTTLMGASLPLLVKQTVDRLHHVGLRTGTLYAINTGGAAFGCFVAGFYAIPHWGMESTTAAAAAVNALVGATAIVISLLLRGAPSTADEAPPQSSPSPDPNPLLWAILAFTVSGFAAIGLEVVWTRLFTLVFKGYSYSFSSMLTVFLIGIASGSIVFAPYADRSRHPESLLGSLQVAIGILVVLLTSLLVHADQALLYLLYLFGYDWHGHILAKFFVSVAILIVPTFLFGAQFPVASRLVTDRAQIAGSRIGSLYGMNVAGSILGALTTGYLLIPLVGTQNSLRSLAALMVMMGMVLRARSGPGTVGVRSAKAIAAALAFAAALLLTPRDLSRQIHRGWLHHDEAISHYEEGASATVMVGHFPDGSSQEKRILVNGSSASNSSQYGLSVNRIQGCLPFLFEKMPKKVLATCFGTGITFGTVSQFDVERIDAVDISPEVIRASHEFREENYGVTTSPRVTIHIDDGRNFLLKSREKYDVVTMEPMPPSLAGVSDLYTREFYELCREHLSPGGIMSQWVPLYFLTLDDVKMLYRTFAESFPYVMVFFYNFDTFMVGSDQPLRLDPKAYRERLVSSELEHDLAAIELAAPEKMFATFLMDRAAMLEFAGDAPLITDDLPHVEFSGPKAVDMTTTPGNYLALTRFAQPVTDFLGHAELPDGFFETLDAEFARNQDQWESAREAASRWVNIGIRERP